MEAAAAAAAPSSVVNNEGEEEEEYELASSAVDQMPAGFRFHPTDSEIIIHYLLNKVIDPRFRAVAIGEINLNKCEPWDLPQKARRMGENEWFFFFEKETKYPTGRRTNRATASGYWKATGKDKEIYYKGNMGKQIVGMKKTLVFYKGRAPKGDKTNWVTHEYRLHGDFSPYNLSNHAMEKWVVCRVFHKKNATNQGVEYPNYHLVDSHTPLPSLTDYSSLTRKPSSSSEIDQIRPTTSSSTLTSNANIMLQEFPQHHQNNLLLPHDLQINSYNNQYYSTPNYSTQMDPMINSILPDESPSLAYYQDGLSSSTMEWYLTNFPIRGNDDGDDDKPNSRILAPDHVYTGGEEPERMCKMEAISFTNSAISPSHDTGVSREMAAAAEINNFRKERESKKPDYIDAVVAEGLCFSPNISDMDSLWSY